MEIIEIIKQAFVFPSKDIGKLAIYIVFSVIIAALLAGGAVTTIFSIVSASAFSIIGVLLFIIALILGFILSGYQIEIVKSGVNLDENVPDFHWKEDFITGIKYLIVNIVYYIIPAIIVLIVGYLTNVHGNIYAIIQESVNTSVNSTMAANATIPAVNTVSNTLMSNLHASLAITAAVAIIVTIIFAFIQTMGVARLAKTDSLNESLNIVEAFKDIGRIGWVKVIATVILLIIIILVINIILNLIASYVHAISILSIIITPYLLFFSCRVVGLLYSDIA